MRLRQILNITLSLLIFACSAKKNSSLSIFNKDSVLKEYLQYSSQDKFYDTNNYNYKILKAHFYNDSFFLKQVFADIERSKKDKTDGFPENLRRHPDISKIKIDEAYQFNYSKTFCDLSIYLTISKMGDSTKLNSVIYQENREPSFLKIFKETETQLSLKDWEEFTQLIEYADFWTLTPFKKSVGFDGDYLSIEAIVRNRFDHNIVRQHKVERRFVSKTALYRAYSLLIKLSKLKNVCDHW